MKDEGWKLTTCSRHLNINQYLFFWGVALARCQCGPVFACCGERKFACVICHVSKCSETRLNPGVCDEGCNVHVICRPVHSLSRVHATTLLLANFNLQLTNFNIEAFFTREDFKEIFSLALSYKYLQVFKSNLLYLIWFISLRCFCFQGVFIIIFSPVSYSFSCSSTRFYQSDVCTRPELETPRRRPATRAAKLSKLIYVARLRNTKRVLERAGRTDEKIIVRLVRFVRVWRGGF